MNDEQPEHDGHTKEEWATFANGIAMFLAGFAFCKGEIWLLMLLLAVAYAARKSVE